MIDPKEAMTLEFLEEWIEEATEIPQPVEPGVAGYVNLFVALGIHTAGSCEGHNGGTPWVLVSGETSDEEIMSLLKLAKLDDGVTIEHGEPYPNLDFEYFEKKVIFPEWHPGFWILNQKGVSASEGEQEKQDGESE